MITNTVELNMNLSVKKFILLTFLVVIITPAFAQFTNTFITYGISNNPVFTTNNFKCVGIGDSDMIWVGSQYGGLYRYDTSTKVWSKSALLTNLFINQIVPDAEGGIWIAQSGTTGLQGNSSNSQGGVNYFPTTSDSGMSFASPTNFLYSSNVRSIYIDTFSKANAGYTKIWAAEATYINNGTTSTGGINWLQDTATNNFLRKYAGLAISPTIEVGAPVGTPSCYAIGGNATEVWVGAYQNYSSSTGGTSQILRYRYPYFPQFIGGYDNLGTYNNARGYTVDQVRTYNDTSASSPKGILPNGFKTMAIYFDKQNRQWIGLQTGGIVVDDQGVWKTVKLPTSFTTGYSVNYNAITEDEYGYVYIGTNSGLIVYQGAGAVNDSNSYKIYTTTSTNNGLPSNNITGIAYDNPNGRVILTSDAGVTFWTVSYKYTSMQWDYSFPNRDGQPFGVAADGVSRIYIKIKDKNTAHFPIKNVQLSVYNWTAAQANLFGGLKAATVNNAYSEEANTGTTNTVTLTDIISNQQYWAWYVSPLDFSIDSTGTNSTLSARYDSLKVLITFTDNSKDSENFKIRIVRPPLVLVHGLASSPAAWDAFGYNSSTTFLNSPLFKYKRALQIDGAAAFIINAKLLLGRDLALGQGADKLNTLQGNVEAMRDMGYASNQVDYMCHSMGGCVIRYAVQTFPDKFFAGKNMVYKNYQQGFTHKIIFINSPHTGSPIPDAVTEYIPQAPNWMNILLTRAYNFLQTPGYDFSGSLGGFVMPVNAGNLLNTSFIPTNATSNLQVGFKTGGQQLLLLDPRVKYHMIVSNVNLTNLTDPVTLAKLNSFATAYGGVITLMNKVLEITRDLPTTPPAIKLILRGLMTSASTVKSAAQALGYIDWYSAQKNYPKFLSSSDMVVPLRSETSDQDSTLPQISLFYTSPTSGALPDANHCDIIHRFDVGKDALNLLNIPVSDKKFASPAPANNHPQPADSYNPNILNRPANVQSGSTTYYDSSKIVISSPLGTDSLFADSALTIKYRIKDTTNLAYVDVSFQNDDTLSISKTLTAQNFTTTVDAAWLGRQTIYAVAAYDNADGSTNYYIDTLTVQVGIKAPLQGFRVNVSDVVTIKAGNLYYPPCQAEYNNNWIALLKNDTAVHITSIDDTTIVKYDSATRALIGHTEGISGVYFSFKGFAYSIAVNTITPVFNNCINSTLSTGNFNNPAIWSKGVVPDICDSIVIQAGHTVALNIPLTAHSLRINSGGILNINVVGDSLQLGQPDDGNCTIDNYGTLNISNGKLGVNGQLILEAASTFNMSAGTLVVNGNTGKSVTSEPIGSYLFYAKPGMTSFAFTGGTLQIINPPFDSVGQAINCGYNFGVNSTLVLGDGISTITSQSNNGFGGNLMPSTIGKLIFNGTIKTGNRHFINTKALNIKGSCQVLSGNLIQSAALNITQ